jgi:hypothetical protein
MYLRLHLHVTTVRCLPRSRVSITAKGKPCFGDAEVSGNTKLDLLKTAKRTKLYL